MEPSRLGYLCQGEAGGLGVFEAAAPLISGLVELVFLPFVARLSALGVIVRFALGVIEHRRGSLLEPPIGSVDSKTPPSLEAARRTDQLLTAPKTPSQSLAKTRGRGQPLRAGRSNARVRNPKLSSSMR